MKGNKRILTAALVGLLLSACGSSSAAATAAAAESTTVSSAAAVSSAPTVQTEPVDVRVSAMAGPTAMGMVKLMKEVDSGEVTSNNYSFELLKDVSEIAPKIAQSQVDIAAVPANMAATLYNKTDGNVEVLAVNTLGVLYICETGDSVNSLQDLKGKTIYASGKGATPEYALDYILENNGIDPEKDVTIDWKSEHSECVLALSEDPEGIAMLPQPFVTVAQAQNDAIKVKIDLNEEWKKLQDDGSPLITGVVIARKDFAESNPQAIQDFLSRYEESIEYVNSNIDEASELIAEYGIVASAEIAKKALPACNIVYLSGDEMKSALSKYLNVLYEANPESVGGALPQDDFYYLG